MPKDYSQRLKLTRILDMLRTDSSEESPLSTNTLCSRLINEFGIVCDRRTLSTDIDYLREHGYEILDRRTGHQKAYYMISSEDKLSVSDMKILMESIQASSFITEEKSDELINKLISIAGGPGTNLLRKPKVYFDVKKHINEDIIDYIYTIDQAMETRKRIGFHYFEYGINGERIYHNDKTLYVADPLAVIYTIDHYYLRAYSHKNKAERNYRIDRMEDVKIIDRIAEHTSNTKDTADFASQIFFMYGGNEVKATLECNKSLINVIYDKFGYDTCITKDNSEEDSYITRVKILESPMFYSWLIALNGKMKIIAPESLKQNYENWIRESLNRIE